MLLDSPLRSSMWCPLFQYSSFPSHSSGVCKCRGTKHLKSLSCLAWGYSQSITSLVYLVHSYEVVGGQYESTAYVIDTDIRTFEVRKRHDHRVSCTHDEFCGNSDWYTTGLLAYFAPIFSSICLQRGLRKPTDPTYGPSTALGNTGTCSSVIQIAVGLSSLADLSKVRHPGLQFCRSRQEISPGVPIILQRLKGKE